MNDELERKLRPIFEKTGVALAYLFGSRARNQATRGSDLDIAVLLDGALSKEERFDVRLCLMGQIARQAKKPADVIILNDTPSLFFQYVIVKEGALLYEKSVGGRLDFESKLLGRYFDYQPFLEDYNEHYVARHLQ